MKNITDLVEVNTAVTSHEPDFIHNCKVPGTGDSSAQTEITLVELKALEDDYRERMSENLELKEKLHSTAVRNAFPDREILSKDDKLVNSYTGLPSFQILDALFRFVAAFIYQTLSTKLTKFQQFILVLMKLRINLLLFDLVFRSMVSEGTVSCIFSQLIVIFDKRISPLVRWPTNEELIQTMPFFFRHNYGLKLVGIIDCFEIFIEKPSDLFVKAVTYSQYKSYNTAKYLICITAQGVIRYISDSYGGRASDKYITKHCGFLDHLLPGDVILADRGFNIQDSVALQGATLDIPAFTRGRMQLTPQEVESTRNKANVRIHVERIIGGTRQTYPILSATAVLPWEYVQPRSDGTVLLDSLVRVCCSLHNLREGIVPFE